MSQPRKPRTRSVPCDPERWPPCVRCGQSYRRAHRWPEGRICHYCYEAARQRHGHCATCGHTGVLPGLASDGQPTCLTCSDIPLQVQCRSCGAESPLGRGSRCWRCQLADLVNTLLQGPDGLIPPSLQPLAQALINMPRPNSGYAWLRQNPAAQDLLRQLGQASTRLIHENLDQLAGTRTVEYLRGLLVEHGCLPPRDRHIARFERWLDTKLAHVDNIDHRKVIDRFARWHLLRQLRTQAAQAPVTPGAFLNAKQTTTVAINFLTWLSGRNRQLDQLTQHDLDAWFSCGPTTRKHVVRFLYWARGHRLINGVEVPIPSTKEARPISERTRLTQLHRALTDDTLPTTTRLLASLVLLFGLSADQIAQLKRSEMICDDNRVVLRIGSTPIELPEPVAVLAKTLLADPRYRLNTAAHPHSPWLFLGTIPGRPMHIASIHKTLSAAGFPLRSTRAGAWHQLVRQAPPAVLADALGVKAKTAANYAAASGADYLTYPRRREI